MAGREISSTLRNLKFMQRAVQKEEKNKEEEEVVSNGFGFSAAISKKCVVITEGDPHPGALRGRMSFQHFNPSIDKLAEELENRSKDPGARTPNSCSQNGSSMNGEGSPNEDSDMFDSKKDLKRKQTAMESEETQYLSKSPQNVHDNQQARSSSSKKKSSKNKKMHDKNNWSVLRPPKSPGMRE